MSVRQARDVEVIGSWKKMIRGEKPVLHAKPFEGCWKLCLGGKKGYDHRVSSAQTYAELVF